MPEIPRDTLPDSTLALLRDPYRYISKRCDRLGTDIFRMRLMLQTTICMRGPEAAALFYDTSRFMRSGAPPRRIVRTLFGPGGVQTLDDRAHRHRKAMFMAIMTPERIAALAGSATEQLGASAGRWESRGEVVLSDELHAVLGRAVCNWAGVPLPEPEVDRRIKDLTALFDAAGAVGPRHWRSRLARRRSDRWCAGVIEDVRGGRLTPPEHAAAHVIAWHRGLDGQLLDPKTAAVELLNVLRPTVAISVFITFAAHALHEHPQWRRRLKAGGAGEAEGAGTRGAGEGGTGDGDELEWFVQEVRRHYPFFPVVGALVREDFHWRGYHFPRGTLVLLDLYGTEHDPRTWERPETFDPERFRSWDGSAFNFIPQGGGDHDTDHRCPGEWATIELMKVTVRFLTEQVIYDVPEQDLRIDYARLPALPRSGFVIHNVRGVS